MTKTKKEFFLFQMILAALGIIALVLFLVLPVAYINNGIQDGGVNGISSIFGVVVSISGQAVTFSSVNGVGLTILILALLASVLTGFMTKYGRGFLIVSSVLLLAAVILTCTYHTSWLFLNGGGQFPRPEWQCGGGQVTAAALMIVQMIGNIVLFRLLKTK